MTDPIADLLTRMRNATLIRQKAVLVPYSNVKFELAKVFEREGFIEKYERVGDETSKQPMMRITLRYNKGESVMRGLKRISTPGRRVYKSYREIPKKLPSLGLLVLSTSGGILTNLEAKQKKLGGEILCEIY
ncbi:MAG: 30S ribosomal protein S8 [Patescibacteria group bacterium]